MRNFLIALILILMCILGWLYYSDAKKCCPTDDNATIVPIKEVKSGPLLFRWGSSAPITGVGWPRMRDSLAMFATDSSSLEIVGRYCLNALPEENENLGLQRASELRKLFTSIPDEHIILISKGIDCSSVDKEGPFEPYAFNVKKRTENIKEIDDKTLIYFPSNSTRKLNSAEVEAYLSDVAERVKKTGESIVLIGHSDSVGPADANEILAQERADIIRDYLISKGVETAKIKSSSKGEAEPIDDNNTNTGRANNRRTELQIIK